MPQTALYYLMIMVLGLVLVGCSFTPARDLPPEASGSYLPRLDVEARETRIDRTDPDWMKQYCRSRILELGTMPVSYERQRGPLISLTPIYQSARFSGRNMVACTLDYYYHPLREEAFAELFIDYRYSQVVWKEFNEAVVASTSARLTADGWLEMSVLEDEAYQPDISFTRVDTREKLSEYLDMYFEKDEELVYELVVVEEH
jgi:hypothetical protein